MSLNLNEYHARGSIRVGLASRNIAPPWPIILPYGKQEPTQNFYNRNIYVKSIVLEVGELRVLLIACDVIGFRKRDADYIKEAVERETGISRDFIILAAIHNHSYPRTSDEKVREFLKDRTVECVKEALDNMFEAKVGFGKRRLPCWLNTNRAKVEGPVDTNLYVMRINDAEGALRGLLFLFPSHPTMLTTAWGGDRLGKIGPEWPEYARKLVESKISEDLMFELYPNVEYRDITTVFLLGAAGDLQPARIFDRYKDRVMDPRWVFVEVLSDHVVDLAKSLETTSEASLTFKWTTVRIPVREKYWERFGRKEYEALVQALILNDACMITVPGEMTCELGLKFQELSGFKYPMVVTIANDYLGYFVSEAEGIENVRYEARGSWLFESRGRLLLNAMLALVNPEVKPIPPIDPERDLGKIEGVVEYETENEVYVGARRECNPPGYGNPPAAPFLGKRVKVKEDGTFFIDKLVPGPIYLYVDEVYEEGARPRLLTWGEPVEVKAGKVSRVKIRIPREFSGRNVKGIRIEDVKVEGYNIICKVRVDGTLSEGDVLRGYLIRRYDVHKHHKTYLYNPLAEAAQKDVDTFIFRYVIPDDYAIFFWIDVNGNGRPEPAVDIMSPYKIVTREDFK